MADLHVALMELKEESESGKLQKLPACAPARRTFRRWAWLIPAVMAAVLMTGVWLFHPPSRSEPAPKVVHVTSYPGSQIQPSLSPDGSRVAFVWDGPKQDNFDIYVKQVGQPKPCA